MGIEDAIKGLEKKFGKGIIYRGDLPEQRYMPSGSLTVDRCIGGGFPVGKIVELYGPEGGGKSSLALHAVREAQRVGVLCGYVDMEHALNGEFAESLGVDFESLVFSQPDFGEGAMEVIKALIPECGLVVFDSVAALVPKDEIDGDCGDTQWGKRAKLMAQSMRTLGPLANDNGCCLLFINQTRMTMGHYSAETTPGGLALKFHASVRLRISRAKDESNEKPLDGGHRMKVKVVKNRCGPPFRDGRLEFYYDRGIDNVSSLLDLCVYDAIIDRRGNSYFYGEEKMGVGKAAAIGWLRERYDEVLERYRGKAPQK